MNTHDESVSNTTPWFFLRLPKSIWIMRNVKSSWAITMRHWSISIWSGPVRCYRLRQARDIWSEYKYERKIELLFEGSEILWSALLEGNARDLYSQKNWPTGIASHISSRTEQKIYTHNTEPLRWTHLQRINKATGSLSPCYELNKCPNLDAAPYE